VDRASAGPAAAAATAPGPASAPDVFAPAMLGPVRLRNRVIKSATFEGRTPKGLVTDELIDYHLAPASGGVGLTTVAYCAVAPEGRTDRHQIHLRPEALPGLRRLTEAVHATGAAVSAQLGHAGPVANGASNRAPSLAPTRRFSPFGGVTKATTPADIERIVAAHAQAARYATDAGFDAVELHFGHNDLASEVAVRALQQVHADDLLQLPLRPGHSGAGPRAVVTGNDEAARTPRGAGRFGRELSNRRP
jgi:2,4-dienoyl-CoA reductase-like NADH-dependent reductase (Old Yellow Enzyme family)